MEYLHIIPAKTGETLEFLRQIEKNDGFSEHKFLVLLSRNAVIKNVPELLAFPNIEYTAAATGHFSKLKWLLKLGRRLKKADVLIWHSLSMLEGRFIPLLYMSRHLCQKSVWREDGTDTESWAQGGGRWKQKIKNHMHRCVRRRIPVVGVPLESEKAYIEKLWPGKVIVDLPYPIHSAYVEKLWETAENRNRAALIAEWKTAFASEAEKKSFTDWLEFEEEEKKETETEEKEKEMGNRHWPSIQIGLSSQRMNDHMGLLQVLGSMKREPMNFYVPVNLTLEKELLANAPQQYCRQVIKRAEELFGENAYILCQKVDAAHYFDYLENLDVALLGNTGASATEYLLFLLGARVKLYMPGSSRVYGYLKAIGVPVHSLDEAKGMTARELVSPEENYTLPECIRWHFDTQAIMSAWAALFADMRKRVGK